MYLLYPRTLTGLMAEDLAVAMLLPVEVPQSFPSNTDKFVHLAAFGLLVRAACLGACFSVACLLVLRFSAAPLSSSSPTLGEVVLVLRPVCSPVKVDQGFMSGCQSHGLCFALIGFVWGQDAVGRVQSFGIVIG